MISVIIPIYNQASKLGATLTSLATQTYKNFEVIIVNDGSTDNPEAAFTKFLETSQSGISFSFFNQENQGAPAARNAGAAKAQGEYLFFCDADAILAPQAFEQLQATLSFNPQASYAYSAFKWGRRVFKAGPFDANRLKREPYIHTMALIRHNDFPLRGWDESLKKFQDWDLWLTMLEEGKYGVFVNQILFIVSPGGRISSWLPSFAYKWLPFLPAVRKYQAAQKIIYTKHQLLS